MIAYIMNKYKTNSLIDFFENIWYNLFCIDREVSGYFAYKE